jgi:flagellar basal-body rod protein FlgB
VCRCGLKFLRRLGGARPRAARRGNVLPPRHPGVAQRAMRRALLRPAAVHYGPIWRPLGRYRLPRDFGTALAWSCPRSIRIMYENLFGIHERALLLSGQRLNVLASNIANADTPNFKARDIDFAAILGGSEGDTQLPLTVTDGAHFSLKNNDIPDGALQYRNPYQASLDGNTVETSVEKAAFSENNVRYQASLTFINNQITLLQYAIAGQ